MMNNRIIWISSISHLEQFTLHVKNKLQVKNAAFPHVRLLTNYVPINYFSKGNLSISNGMVSYIAELSKEGWIKKYYNLDTKLQFSLLLDEILKIDRYMHPEHINNYYRTNWIRIKTSKKIFTEDILLSQGGSGPSMNGIIQGTNEIYYKLKELKG
ncbi:hypothetical protein [Paenibacillus sp. LjRoot56]|uniref:hypothetical protein n=1 Tax=Paenibacillus sp. LjRoot56 TaxID=3342333 RepID=UPI003ECC2B9B